MNQKTEFFSARLRVLHFAPEDLFQRTFRALPNLEYISADLENPSAMVKMDITDIRFDDDSFDVIMCIHVLEHIIDDRKAMRELFRVLKKGGWAILQTPIERETTYEDPGIVTPRERKRAFGKEDHVRKYGRDYVDRLEEAGFEVEEYPYGRELSEEELREYGFDGEEILFICRKPGL